MKKTMSRIAVLAIAFAMVMSSCATTKKKGSDIPNQDFENIYLPISGQIYVSGAQYYDIKAGDMLTSIARAASGYGSSNVYYWPLIMAATSQVADSPTPTPKISRIDNPDLIMQGSQLVIPNLQANIATADQRKRVAALLNGTANIYETHKVEGREADIRELRALAAKLLAQ